METRQHADRTSMAKSLKALGFLKIAALIPCYNEETTIAGVIAGISSALPAADIYVYDNNSNDGTAEIARRAGAIVRHEARQGKGHVVRRMFSDIEADIYVLIDGDETYDAAMAGPLVTTLLEGQLDFVNGARLAHSAGAYRPGHRLGNFVLTRLVQLIFGRQFNDMLSGYKVLSRRFVKSFPAMANGFEIETELAVHALELKVAWAEIDTVYNERPQGSTSKLRTYHDGARILMLIARLLKDERPYYFFGISGFILVLAAMTIGAPLILTYLETGLVPRIPSAILVVGLTIIGIISIFTGLILDVTTKGRQEIKRLFYLSMPGPPPLDGASE